MTHLASEREPPLGSAHRPPSLGMPGTEENLATTSGFISAVLDTVSALVVVLDREGRVVLFNQACSQTTGFSFEDVKGRHFWDVLLIPAEVEQVRSVFAQLAAGTFPNKNVNYWVTKDGQRRLISWSNTALLGDGDDVAFVIGTGIDITEHAMLERQLHQAQKMEAVGRLAGGVAHDFGSVLTAIRGYAERARRHLPEDSPGCADIDGVIRASERGTDLISRLLVISRPREIEPTLLDMDGLIAETSAILRRVVGDDVELLVELDAKDSRVLGDRSQVEQVLLNLAVNARDAMPDGGVLKIRSGYVMLDEDEARTHGNVAPGDYVALACSDDGIGMDRDTLQRIFEPFFTTKTEGTGLGLSTVYGIVKSIGGHVLVESEPDRGTTFTVFLPKAS